MPEKTWSRNCPDCGKELYIFIRQQYLEQLGYEFIRIKI